VDRSPGWTYRAATGLFSTVRKAPRGANKHRESIHESQWYLRDRRNDDRVGFRGRAGRSGGELHAQIDHLCRRQIMPKKVANSKANAPTNPNCVGDNVSPQLSWSNESFVLLMIDPEGRGDAGVNHWVAYGIAPSVTGFAEGDVSKQTDKYVGGKSTQGVAFYSGPCTPPNQTPHHYTFVLIATDLAPSELPPGLTKEEVTAKLAPPGQPPAHTKGVAGIVGLFVNPWHE
jgi:Raf kinase inhibitor-like YbhB/YbcL family protein